MVSGVYLVCFIGTRVTEYAVFTHITGSSTALVLIDIYICLNVLRTWDSFQLLYFQDLLLPGIYLPG